jgi:starvation-inducible DNA-binding protein
MPSITLVVGRDMEPELGLKGKDREGVIAILNGILADEFILYTETRNYHWNVSGPQFGGLHKFFEEQYNALNDIVDEVAERARTIGGRSFGTLAEFSKYARLKENPGEVPPARDMVGRLLKDHEALIRQLRQDLETCVGKYHDVGTNNFLTDLMNKHEKMAWMLRAHLEGGV